jgi:hypothetical protein
MPFVIPNAEQPPTYPAQAVLDATDIGCIVSALGLTGVSNGCAVTAGSGMKVNVAAGAALFAGALVPVAAASGVTVAPASTTDRRDAVVVDTTGTVSVLTGTPCPFVNWTTSDGINSPPIKPTLTANYVLLADLMVPAAVSSITSAMLFDRTTIILTNPRVAVARQAGSSAPVTTASGLLIPANAQRQQLEIYNNSLTEIVFLSLGSTASLNAGARLNVNGGSWSTPQRAGGTVYTGAIYGICTNNAGGTAAVSYAEV